MTGYNHKQFLDKSGIIREVVFGMEDGMVSTLGAISGIAIGSGDQFTVLLAGAVIIAVESVSMGIGSYISNRISKEVDDRTIEEEKQELKAYPSEEKKELFDMFVRDGWPKTLALQMTKFANARKHLMLKEMQYRELGISPHRTGNPIINAVSMYGAYVIGGFIPLVSYIFLPVSLAISVSTIGTLCSLFLLGVIATKFTGSKPIRSGLRILLLGAIALSVGLVIGNLAKSFE